MVETPRDKKRISATVLPPRAGDFTLRSAKSRAAARALVLARQPKMTREDLECLLIHRISRHLHAGTVIRRHMLYPAELQAPGGNCKRMFKRIQVAQMRSPSARRATQTAATFSHL